MSSWLSASALKWSYAAASEPERVEIRTPELSPEIRVMRSPWLSAVWLKWAMAAAAPGATCCAATGAAAARAIRAEAMTVFMTVVLCGVRPCWPGSVAEAVLAAADDRDMPPGALTLNEQNRENPGIFARSCTDLAPSRTALTTARRLHT